MSPQTPTPSAALADAYARTDYRVRLAQGGYATIRTGEPLPAALRSALPRPDAPWGFITAWNPGSEQVPYRTNRAAQRLLLETLRGQTPALHVLAGVGVGAGADAGKRPWREPSLFVAGASFALLDTLMLRFGQVAMVRGTGTSVAELRWACALDDAHG